MSIVVDIAVVAMILMFAIVGMKNGFLKQIISLAGIIIVLIVSFMFKEQVGNLLCKFLPFFTFKGTQAEGLVALNILIYQLVGFLIVFSILMGIYSLILHITGIIQKVINKTIIFLLPSKIGGFIIGALEGYILTFVVLMVLTIPLKNVAMFKDSYVLNLMMNKTPIISKYTKDLVTIIDDTYIIVDGVSDEKTAINEANLKMIDGMLKYKIVSKKTVQQLIVLDKLNTIENIEQVIDKY